MLPHYSPLKVAEVFSTLAGLHPERIDLGLGRAPGTDPMTMLALQRDRRQRSPDDFPEQLTELLALLEDRMPPDHPFARHARTLPGRPERPEPWLLGSSPQSAIWAGELGLPYAIADFINPGGAALAADYRSRFLDSERLPAPRVIACTIAICAETDEEAERIASSGRMMFSLLRMGRLIPIPPPEKALAYLETRERARPPGRPPRDRGIAGHGPRGARGGRRRVRDRGADAPDDHLRPRGPQALLRADRRGTAAVSLFRRREPTPQVHIGDPRFDDWEVVADYEELETGLAFRDGLGNWGSRPN